MSDEVPAGEFKAKCLKLMDEVARTRTPVTITKRGRPVARLVPIEESARDGGLFGYMAGTLTVLGDVIDVPAEAWAAETGEEDALLLAAEPRPAYGKAKTSKSQRRP